MSKKIRVGFALVLLLVLAACGAKTGEEAALPDGIATDEGLQETPAAEGERALFRQNNASGELPPATGLAAGMILLEDTAYAIDPDQAQVLIPFWKLYLNLLDNDATAVEELEAIVREIQEVLSTDQLAAIAELALSQESMLTLMEELGLDIGFRLDREGTGSGLSLPEGLEGMRSGGGTGRGQGSLEGVDPELMATMQARREEMGGAAGMRGANMTQIPLIEALIEILEGKRGE